MIKKILLLLLIPTIAFSAEDFTTYTVNNDSGGADSGYATIAVTSSQIEGDNYKRRANIYVSKDYGAGYFCNYDIDLQINVNDHVNPWSGHTPWALANIPATNRQKMIDDGEGIMLEGYCNASCATDYLRLREVASASTDSVAIAEGTDYYVTFIRTDSTITADVYSDSGRTTLISGGAIAVTHDSTTYQYMGVASGYATTNQEISDMTVNDLTIVSNDCGGAPRRTILLLSKLKGEQ